MVLTSDINRDRIMHKNTHQHAYHHCVAMEPPFKGTILQSKEVVTLYINRDTILPSKLGSNFRHIRNINHATKLHTHAYPLCVAMAPLFKRPIIEPKIQGSNL